jgi:hypothetical protein
MQSSYHSNWKKKTLDTAGTFTSEGKGTKKCFVRRLPACLSGHLPALFQPRRNILNGDFKASQFRKTC